LFPVNHRAQDCRRNFIESWPAIALLSWVEITPQKQTDGENLPATFYRPVSVRSAGLPKSGGPVAILRQG
jgi:hypothetical protein